MSFSVLGPQFSEVRGAQLLSMQVTVRCPSCAGALPVTGQDAPPQIKCGGCNGEIALTWSEAVKADREVDACPVCAGRDFYSRKDFDPHAGLAIVIIGALVSAGFYWFGRDLTAYAVLAGAVLLDLLIYHQLREVTVCYRCHAEFRGASARKTPAFDLHTADRLEHEYERKIGRRVT